MSRSLSCLVLSFLFLATTFAATAQAQLPDVLIYEIELIPYNPVVGEEVNIWVTVFNDGPVPTPSNTPVGVGVQIDGAHVGSFFVRSNLGQGPTRPLAANTGHKWKISPSWTATAGTHQVCAFADDIDRFVESNETNNSSCISVTVPPPVSLPDLVVSQMAPQWTNPAPGETVNILIEVENSSSTATPTGVVIGTSVEVNGVYDGAFFARNGLGQTIHLEGGQNSGKLYDWTASVGTHEICATVDDINRISETNETNNRRCTTLVVSPVVQPDVMILSGILLKPENPAAGQTVDVRAWIYNQGNGATPPGVPVGTGFQIDGVYAGSFFVRGTGGVLKSLGGGLGQPGGISWVATSGTHQICAIADDIDRFLESDETNNVSCRTVVVP